MATGIATQTDGQGMETVATVAIAIEARAMVMEAPEATEDRMDTALRMMSSRPLLLQIKMHRQPTTTLSMPSGPLTTLRIQAKTHTLHMAVSKQSWLNIHRDMANTMVKLTVRHSLLYPALGLEHHHRLLQSLLHQAMGLPLHRRPLLDRLQVATARYELLNC